MLQELNLQEMNEVKGGVTQEQYCTTLVNLTLANWDNWDDQQRLNAFGGFLYYDCNDVFRVFDFLP